MSLPDKTKQRNTVIFLIGFMGAGKTTVGQALARHLHYEFRDLDRLIEARAGKSVAEIFAESGEPEFRRLENETIQTCRDLTHAVVALGGGAYTSEENRLLLRSIGTTVWLDCPLRICLRRISSDPSRPLLGDENEMSELLERRRAAYALADHIVRTGKLSPRQLVIEISRTLAIDPKDHSALR